MLIKEDFPAPVCMTIAFSTCRNVIRMRYLPFPLRARGIWNGMRNVRCRKITIVANRGQIWRISSVVDGKLSEALCRRHCSMTGRFNDIMDAAYLCYRNLNIAVRSVPFYDPKALVSYDLTLY